MFYLFLGGVRSRLTELLAEVDMEDICRSNQ